MGDKGLIPKKIEMLSRKNVPGLLPCSKVSYTFNQIFVTFDFNAFKNQSGPSKFRDEKVRSLVCGTTPADMGCELLDSIEHLEFKIFVNGSTLPRDAVFGLSCGPANDEKLIAPKTGPSYFICRWFRQNHPKLFKWSTILSWLKGFGNQLSDAYDTLIENGFEGMAESEVDPRTLGDDQFPQLQCLPDWVSLRKKAERNTSEEAGVLRRRLALRRLKRITGRRLRRNL